MSNKNHLEQGTPTRFLLLSLIVVVLATTVIDVIIPLFLLEIAKSFHVSPAIASQIRTFSAIAQVVPALLLGFLSVRFKAKSLLIVGVLCIIVASVGSYFAYNIGSMQFFYSFNGIGSVLVSAMALVIIGEFYPLHEKPKLVGVITATGALGYVVGAPLSALISNLGSWRLTFTLLVLPISIAGVILAFYLIPSTPQVKQSTILREPFWSGFMEILRNKSAVACLIFQIFFLSLFAIGTFSIAFFKDTFKITTDFASWIVVGSALSGAFGSLISGRFLINRLGRKTITVIASLLSGILAIFAFYMPSLWAVLVFRYSSLFLWGIAVAAGASLMLEQVPKFRGPMMSLRVAFAGIGSAIGVAIGGAVLTLYDYPTIALTLGTLGIIGSITLWLIAKDPCKIKMQVVKFGNNN